jgi:hypothetical protein
MKRQMHRHTNKDDNFIVTAPSYKIMQQATIVDFLSYMDGFGTYQKTDAVFEMHGGGKCFFRTATDPDSIVGITRVRAIYGDEAGKYPLYFWENIQGRSSFKQAPIMLTTSPYSLNWVYKDIIKPTIKGERTDVNLIQAASWENPYFGKKEYDRKKRTMDKRRFEMMYGGEWNEMAGLVYSGAFDQECMYNPVRLPTGTKYYAGVDWGYNDPFVIVIHAITPNGNRFQVSEVYKTQTTINDQIEMALAKQRVFDVERWYCDPSRPDAIEAFQRSGLKAVGAENAIQMGIDRTYQEFKTGRFKIFRGSSPNTLDELEMYHYPDDQDLRPDQDAKAIKPVDQYNHCMDAMRYVVIETVPKRVVKNEQGKRKPRVAKGHEERF